MGLLEKEEVSIILRWCSWVFPLLTSLACALFVASLPQQQQDWAPAWVLLSYLATAAWFLKPYNLLNSHSTSHISIPGKAEPVSVVLCLMTLPLLAALCGTQSVSVSRLLQLVTLPAGIILKLGHTRKVSVDITHGLSYASNR